MFILEYLPKHMEKTTIRSFSIQLYRNYQALKRDENTIKYQFQETTRLDQSNQPEERSTYRLYQGNKQQNLDAL